ncbi:hypothetical protein Tco_0639439 [Tanacetum coccineum]
MSSRRPNILNRSSTQTTELPTQEDQICGYRAMTRDRYQAARATRRVFQPYLLADISWIRLHALHRRSAGTNRLGGSSETPDGKICGKSLVPWSRSLFRNTGSGIRITWQGGE